jgi:hypothetical protein
MAQRNTAVERRMKQRITGAPVGGASGDAICDTCNRRLSDGVRCSDGPDVEADTVYAYVTKIPASHRWMLRWVSCETCGPIGEADDPGTAVATATLDYDSHLRAFTLTNVRNIEVNA